MNTGNVTAIYICPACGCPDLMTAQSALALPAKERRTVCPNCKWEGMLSDAAGIATTEKIFDTKAILNLLLFVVSKHAAGPISQALQFVGLIDKDDQEGLDKVMRAATSGMIEQAFMAAAEHAASKAKLSPEQQTAVADIEKMRCPDCGGRHIIGEEMPEELGGGACKTCDGRGMVKAEVAAKPPAPKMTEENVHLFHVITGEYSPGWQERENAKVPAEVRVLNRVWELYVRGRVLPYVRNAEGADRIVTHILVPEWVYQAWSEVHGPNPTMLGYPLLISHAGDAFGVSLGGGGNISEGT